jgi:hypothetical protein
MRYRINRPIAGRKDVRVIALDGGARAIIERASPQSRAHARFLSVAEPRGHAGERRWVSLLDTDGAVTSLAEETCRRRCGRHGLPHRWGCRCSNIISAASTVRAIMTAGIVVGEGAAASETVAVLRPHTRVLVVSAHEEDVSDLPSALRA